jgi:hypothetical protein
MESRPVWHLQPAKRLVPILTFLCLFATSARAANTCPWMNEATASGLLGGEAVGTYQAAPGPKQAATCTFTQENSGVTRTLVIQVTTTSDAPERIRTIEKTCTSSGLPLQAIGNEAVECASDERGSRPGEQVVGRVRDQLFMIRISSSGKNDPDLTRSALKSRISSAAEQVAGNLF